MVIGGNAGVIPIDMIDTSLFFYIFFMAGEITEVSSRMLSFYLAGTVFR